MDPWGSEVGNKGIISNFEDNFQPSTEKLADSPQYLALLGKLIVFFYEFYYHSP